MPVGPMNVMPSRPVTLLYCHLYGYRMVTQVPTRFTVLPLIACVLTQPRLMVSVSVR